MRNTTEENTQNTNLKLCECGCGKPVTFNKYRNIKFIRGHNSRGQNHPRYRETRMNGEYIYVKSPNHPNKDSHGTVKKSRLIMEQFLGRYLDPKEVVHHIDHNPKNDVIENLMLFPSHSEHVKYEGRIDTSNRFCLLCGSKTTWTSRKGYQLWLNYQNGYICNRCYCKIRRLNY